MKKKHKLQFDYFNLSNIELDVVMEEEGYAPAGSYTQGEWIEALVDRLAALRRDFLEMLDGAAEDPEVLVYCDPMRLKIEMTKARIARMGRSTHLDN